MGFYCPEDVRDPDLMVWMRTSALPKFKKLLDGVDTEVCKQVFSWLKGYGYILKSMSPSSFWWYMFNVIIELHNEKTERALRAKGLMPAKQSRSND